ncbi:alkaline phosphatase D family protein [Nocardioides sp. Kera G14]|uniref:alkaline phosphatase D family protein n=1 Tax=Nocardioides sp. Kera G14 TaxID=2884264 RepID=UPI001D12B184|nr:alkaline phosphatase D family protein [Nocardioides sp. Kera G14]UDY24141.1 alkaline phosphatase D family protein [Nocardioides sp. Kera G14]
MTLLGRRTVLAGGVAAVGAGPGLIAARWVGDDVTNRRAAALVRGRITQPHAVRAGDVTTDSAVIWARSGDTVGRLHCRVDSGGVRKRSLRGGVANPGNDFTSRLVLTDLQPGREYVVTTWFAQPDGTAGQPRTTRFTTASDVPTPTSFVWSGDTCGQGWGIDESRGGLAGYAAVRALKPDFFLHCGDNIYADMPMKEHTHDAWGHSWTNVLDESVTKVAETLADFRGRHRYALQDQHVAALYAEVPTIAMWDDHETLNNWYPGEVVDDDRYTTERRCDVLSARGRRAWQEYMPIAPSIATPSSPNGRIYRRIPRGPHLDVFCLDMRSYRDANGYDMSTDPGVDRGILGWEQEQWLLRELSLSTATWKVVAADMPLSVATSHADDRDSVAQTDPGPPRGRELEIARLLSGLKANGVKNVVWVTADVHYTAAHHYSPERAAFTDFDPFWEFISGPIHAGTFETETPDGTFGPEVVYAKGNTSDLLPMSPAAGNQFIGQVEIAIDGRLTVTLHSVGDGALWTRAFDPAHA